MSNPQNRPGIVYFFATGNGITWRYPDGRFGGDVATWRCGACAMPVEDGALDAHAAWHFGGDPMTVPPCTTEHPWEKQ